MSKSKKHAAKFKEHAKTREVKTKDDVYAYLKETCGEAVAESFKKGMEGGFKDMAKKAKKALIFSVFLVLRNWE